METGRPNIVLDGLLHLRLQAISFVCLPKVAKAVPSGICTSAVL